MGPPRPAGGERRQGGGARADEWGAEGPRAQLQAARRGRGQKPRRAAHMRRQRAPGGAPGAPAALASIGGRVRLASGGACIYARVPGRASDALSRGRPPRGCWEFLAGGHSCIQWGARARVRARAPRKCATVLPGAATVSAGAAGAPEGRGRAARARRAIKSGVGGRLSPKRRACPASPGRAARAPARGGGPSSKSTAAGARASALRPRHTDPKCGQTAQKARQGAPRPAQGARRRRGQRRAGAHATLLRAVGRPACQAGGCPAGRRAVKKSPSPSPSSECLLTLPA